MPSNSLELFLKKKKRKYKSYSVEEFNFYIEQLRNPTGKLKIGESVRLKEDGLIRDEIKKPKETYKEIAKKLGISPSFLYRLRKGGKKSYKRFEMLKSYHKMWYPTYLTAIVWIESEYVFIHWGEFDCYQRAKDWINEKANIREIEIIDFILTIKHKARKRFIAKYFNRYTGESKYGLYNKEEVLFFLESK